jgi:hypothetical protein
MESKESVEAASVHSVVTRLPSKIVQIQCAHIAASGNNGDYVELIALYEDGSLWFQFRSNGYANVPTDGKWYEVHPSQEGGEPYDQYGISLLD